MAAHELRAADAPDVREAKQNARMLLYVARARFRHGTPPWEHADALAAVAQDERLRVRMQRVAAELLAKLRMAGGTLRPR